MSQTPPGSPPTPSQSALERTEREPQRGPIARWRAFVRPRLASPTLPFNEVDPTVHTQPPSARQDALREYRARLREHHAGKPLALARIPSAAPDGAPRRLRLAAPAIPGEVNWVPLGPGVVLNGQAATRPPVSGRVNGLGFSADGQRVYVGTANGGVFRSDDGGWTFYPTMNAFDLQPTTSHSDSLSIGALAVDPEHPERVYVGSGEGSVSDAFFGVGPVVSFDGGASWHKEPWNPPVGTGGPWFYALAIDPADRDRVLAATSAGLMRRQPRNEAVNTLPLPRPQGYQLRYNSADGAPSVEYWGADGNSTFTVWAQGAAAWAAGLVFCTFVLNGAPWLLSYRPANGDFRVFEIDAAGQPQLRQNGTWTAGLLLMTFELNGQPRLVRYTPATGSTSLDTIQPDGTLASVWAAHIWTQNLTQFVPFTLQGMPVFLSYTSGTGMAMLQGWTGTGDTFNLWAATRDVGTGRTFTPYELRSIPFIQSYNPTNGRTQVLRWSPDGDYTALRQGTLPTGLDFTCFPLTVWEDGQARDELRCVGYAPTTGLLTMYRLYANGTRRSLFTRKTGTDLRFVPFQMGFEWAHVRDAQYTPQPPTRHWPPPVAQRPATSVVVARRGGTTTFYAGFQGGDVYSSVDGGASWRSLGPVVPNVPPLPGTMDPGAWRLQLAVQATNPDVVYAQTQNGEIWRYEGGASPLARGWFRVQGEPPNYVGHQGNYDLAMAVAPDEVNRLYIGGSTLFARVGTQAQWSASIFRCEVDPASMRMLPVYIGASAHADIHALVFPNQQAGELWVGCDGGVFSTDDAARANVPLEAVDRLFRARNAGLTSMTANGIGQHPTQDAILFSSTQDNGCQRFTGGAAWSLPDGVFGDSGAVVVFPNPADNGQHVLASYNNNTLYYSPDGGNTYTQVTGRGTNQIPLRQFTLGPYQVSDGVNFYAPLVSAGAALPARAAFGTRAPWICDNLGTANPTWVSIPNNTQNDILGFDGNFNIRALAFSADGLKLYVGLNNGFVIKYTNAGAAWTGAYLAASAPVPPLGPLPIPAPPLPPYAVPVTGIAVDPRPGTNGDSIYITYGGDLSANPNGWKRVWYYDGVAGTWTAYSGNAAGPASRRLMNIQHNTVLARWDGANTHLYVGADLGVWHSANGGTSWEPFGTGLPESAVLDLKLFPATGAIPELLRATAHGRGLYEYVLDPDARFRRNVQLYLRATLLDRGLYPVQDGGADPTRPAHIVNHRDGTCMKLTRPLQNPEHSFGLPAHITFVEFADARALPDQSTDLRVNTRCRLYLEVNNRGIVPGDDVRVMVLLSRQFAPLPPPPPPDDYSTLTAPPALPGGYETNVQNGTFVTGADWNTLAILQVSDVRAGLPEVLAVDFPADTLRTSGLFCVLAIAHSDADRFTSNQTNVDTLVTNDCKVAMKYLFVHP